MGEYLLASFTIIFVVQVVFFAFAAFFKTDKVTDLSYGLTFVLLAWALLSIKTDFSFWALLLVLMVTFWGLRLSGFLFLRILKIKKDPRFDGIRENPIRFARFWTLQAISIWIILLPVMIGIYKEDTSLNLLSIFGFLVFSFGLLIETIADLQKFAFKNNPDNKKVWIETGIWRFSRHPNYFGEILVWIGIFDFVAPFLSGTSWLAIVSPIYISVLLLFVTGIPPLEKSYDQRYGADPDYQKYKASTSVLIPLPVKK